MLSRKSAFKSPSFMPCATLLCAAIVSGLIAAPSRAADVPFGPRPGAVLSVEKLAPIEGFVNGEVAAGRIPGAIVLIQRHGRPVYFKCFGQRDVEKGVPMTAD